MIAVIDYGMGNLRSVAKALEFVGCEVRVVSEPQALRDARGIVLPGVGAFAKAMENLQRQGLVEPLIAAIQSGKPYLGICLGLQLLLDESEERFDDGSPAPKGFGIIAGRVRRLPAGVKVPQIGWNQLHFARPSRLYEEVPDGSYVYFVHSYYAEPADPAAVAAWTEYGVRFASALERENVMAVQFHPEKSGRVGLKILANFKKVAAA